MKNLYKIILITAFLLVLPNSIIKADDPPISEEEEYSGEIPGAEITCSSGSCGRCFF